MAQRILAHEARRGDVIDFGNEKILVKSVSAVGRLVRFEAFGKETDIAWYTDRDATVGREDLTFTVQE